MAVNIIEVETNPLGSGLGNVNVSLCGHDDEPDNDHPGMVRRTFVGEIEEDDSAEAVANVKQFVLDVAGWLGMTSGDIYLHIPVIVVSGNSLMFEIRPVVWVYGPPIS